MMPGWCCSGVMLQSDRFCRFLRTSVRRRLTCASYFEGMPYAVSSMIRPGSWLVCGTGSGAARAEPAAANALPVRAAVLRRKFLRLGLLDMGPPPVGQSSMAPWFSRGKMPRFPKKHGASRNANSTAGRRDVGRRHDDAALRVALELRAGLAVTRRQMRRELAQARELERRQVAAL